MDESDFLQELRQMVVRRASTMHLVDTMAFVNEIAERLEEDPVFGEFIQAEYSDVGAHGKQMKLHGFTEMDDSDGAVSMVIGRWADGLTPGALLTGDIEQLGGWLENFASEALTRKLDERIAEASPPYQLAHILRNKRSVLSCIRFHIFSNQPLSQRYKRESRSELSGIPTETHIWDLQRLAALYGSSREREAVEIHLADFGSGGIPCIEASATDQLTSYRCRMRGIEVRELTDADWTAEGVIVRRHKGSLDNITRWCPELKEAWEWLANHRNEIWREKSVVPLAPDKRILLVTEAGRAVGRNTLNSAWQRAMQQALKAGAVTAETRFGLHATKHRGATDTPGTRRDKQDAAGHKSPAMTDVYNHELDVYDPAGTGTKAG